MAWGNNHQTRSIMSSLGGFPSLSASLGGKKLTSQVSLTRFTVTRTFGNKVLVPPWRPKTMLQLWVLRLFKSLGKQRKTAVLVIGKKPPEKRNGTKSPWKNGGKFGNITNSFEVCGLFSGAKWLVLGRGWDGIRHGKLTWNPKMKVWSEWFR